jgi:multiple antibiotic resistance protein
MNLSNILVITVTLFAVIDMLGNIPLVISLRKKHGEIESLKSSIVSAFIMLLFLFTGKSLFNLLGIEVSHFAIAGSLLLMYFGVKMVLGIDETEKNKEKSNNATVFPMAFPLIAGPGTLSTILSFRADYSDLEIAIAILINAIVIFIVLKSSKWIQKILGPNGINLMERFFGIILISIGIKMFLDNLLIAIQTFNDSL